MRSSSPADPNICDVYIARLRLLTFAIADISSGFTLAALGSTFTIRVISSEADVLRASRVSPLLLR